MTICKKHILYDSLGKENYGNQVKYGKHIFKELEDLHKKDLYLEGYNTKCMWFHAVIGKQGHALKVRNIN